MISVKDLHTQQTVNAAVRYITISDDISDLRENFNSLCAEFGADEFDMDDLSFDIHELVENIQKEGSWIKNIAAKSEYKRTLQEIEYVVDEFICKYWWTKKEDVTAKHIADVLRVADTLSRRHIVAQRIVIESISKLHSKEQLQKLDRIMDWLAMNPKLNKSRNQENNKI